MLFTHLIAGLAAGSVTLACESCFGPQTPEIHPRHVRRMQPEALNATTSPKAPLEWGQISFIHSTDTHGWLEGHLKEKNYGADWGDFKSFVMHMRAKADRLNVDLLLVDTGDLHDGAGLSDATTVNGEVSNPIFENVPYDLLTIGNHELYIGNITRETATQFSKYYGDRYLTSNVQWRNSPSDNFTDIGKKYRYFTTKHGIRIMAYGVLFDFLGNDKNTSKVTNATDMVKESWFINTLNSTSMPVDLFVLIGHNPVRTSVSSSTLGVVQKAIRKANPDTPIQLFGGHTHIRDFTIYDTASTGLESGRYCETLGWLSMSGLNSSSYHGAAIPSGVPNPTRKATKAPSTASASSSTTSATPTVAMAPNNLLYSRRYLDWNRLTFNYHAQGSQDGPFDFPSGLNVTKNITYWRNELNLTSIYGCAPQTYCQYCKPFGADGNIFGLLSTALSATVINPNRSSIPRLILINTGSIRFDLVQGPFTYDDSFIVSPFNDAFQYVANVPYSQASQVLGILNAGPFDKRKRDLEGSDFNFQAGASLLHNTPGCQDSPDELGALSKRSLEAAPVEGENSWTRSLQRRQNPPTLTAGYATTDDFGTDGDDTPHSKIPNYDQPENLQANGSFPTDGSLPTTVDLVFLDYIERDVLPALNKVSGNNYSTADVKYYLPPSFTTNSYLPAYAKMFWQTGVNGSCPSGQGVQKRSVQVI